MYLVNLTVGQWLAILGGVSAVVVALYLLDRSRRRQVVATLRFWVAAQAPPETRHRRRIQQPLSLVLQLISIALLLLALAQLRFGARAAASRDHVLILDTSAWMAARSGRGTLIDEAKASARAYLRGLPSSDRVMLVRADALATPATGFESDRRVLEAAIAQSRPGGTALQLNQALQFAGQAQKLHGGRRGEIVFIGAGRISEQEAESPRLHVPNLRVLPVPAAVANCGIRKIGLRRSTAGPDVWEILVAVRNYGAAPRTVTLGLAFGGAPAGTRRLVLAPAEEQNGAFEYRTRSAGWLEARLLGTDAFPGDDVATLELPQQKALKVTVYSAEPDLLRPVLTAHTLLEPAFRPPEEYRPPAADEVLIADRFRPQNIPEGNVLLIEPPAAGSPVPVRTTVTNAQLAHWRSDHPLGSGLRAVDLRLGAAQVYEPGPEDVVVAECEAGPVIVARQGKSKLVLLGFHPARSALRYELATPLLFANILRWMAPDIFRRWELNAGSVGTVSVALDPGIDAGSVRVLAENGQPLAFTVQGRNLRFFAGSPGTVRVQVGDREMVYSLMLPEVGEARWVPPEDARRGLPQWAPVQAAARDVWRVLAVLGALGLLLEWLLFGQPRARLGPGLRRLAAVIGMPQRKARPAAAVRKALP